MRTRSGFGLVEMMVALGISVILLYGLMSVTQNSMKAQNNVTLTANIDNAVALMSLQAAANCPAMLVGPPNNFLVTTPAGATSPVAFNSTYSPPVSGSTLASPSLTSPTLLSATPFPTPTAVNYSAVLSLSFTKPSQNMLGAPTVQRTIPLMVTVDSTNHNLIKNCQSAAQATSAPSGGGANLISGSVALTGSGNWTVPPGVYSIQANIVGGGAGGGGGSDGTSQSGHGGGGGGAGGSFSIYILYLTPGAQISYSVGTGGAGGAGLSCSAGTDGQSTTFNGIVAGGGSHGGCLSHAPLTSSNEGAGGSGGSADTTQSPPPGAGFMMLTGQVGSTGGDGSYSSTCGASGSGGNSLFGTGGVGGSGYTPPTTCTHITNNGTGYGAGGSGGTKNAPGGSGSNGTVTIRY